MKRMSERHERLRPYGRDDLYYVHEGRDGAYYRGRDGLEVRLASAERDAPVQRDRLSVVGVLLAMLAGGVERR